MTDAQLSLLLLSLLDDLEGAIDAVRAHLPDDSPLQYGDKGDFAVLYHLTEWVAKWRERVKVLSGERNE